MTDSPRVLGNRYEIGDLLGRGGMAEVHLGRDTRLGRVVAIKLLRTDLARDPVFQARFRREAQSAAALNHPAIVAVYDTGEEQLVEPGGGLVALPYIVMEYVEGRTLRELLRGGRPIDLGLALELTSGVLSALDYSHRAGIVHRDIKPANVMLTPAGDVKVMDFGIARALADASATMTQTSAVIGTAQYLSPEQARGETVDARSDLYSAGCLLFELVTGRPPFVADSPVAVAYQHVREAPPRPSDLNPAIPEDLDRVILHSLAKDRETRYQTAADFRADVENLRAGRTVYAPMPGLTPVPTEPSAQAVTEYYGQVPSGTRALPAVRPEYGETMLPGAAGALDDTAFPSRRDAAGRDSKGGRGVGYVLLGLGVVAVFVLVTYLVQNIFSGPPAAKTVKVPYVTALTLDAATKALGALGLKVESSAVDSDLPATTVISQSPPRDTPVSAGSTVALTVSGGPGTVTVPDVSNYTQPQARDALAGLNLTVGNVTYLDSTVPKDHVVRTDPKALSSVAKGTPVGLIMSTGQVAVPDVTKKSLTDAAKLLSALRINYNTNPVPSNQPVNTVVKQSIPAGTKVDAGTGNITLDVAVAAPSPTPTPTPTPDQQSPSPGGPSTDPNQSPSPQQ